MTSQEKYLPIDVDFHYLDEDKDSHQTMKNDETPRKNMINSTAGKELMK